MDIDHKTNNKFKQIHGKQTNKQTLSTKNL